VDIVEYPAPTDTRPGTRSAPGPPWGGLGERAVGAWWLPPKPVSAVGIIPGHLSDGRERRGGLYGGVSCASVMWRPVCRRESPVICQLYPPHPQDAHAIERGGVSAAACSMRL
jgi:hypothetical protein